MGDKRELFPMINNNQSPVCCGPVADPDLKSEQLSLNDQSWLVGEILTPKGAVSSILTRLEFNDIRDRWKARWGLGRMDYAIPPKLYAVGVPDDKAPVLVTANYKLTFDCLRRELAGLNVWLLVLDTKGINVWCAAGKGTFGTAELVESIEKTGLAEIVSHRVLILPQLGAPGVSAHEVRHQTGFKISYGPVRASDLPAYLKKGNKATLQMRQVRFNLPDRLSLVPVELTVLGKPLLYITAALLLLNLAASLLGSFTLTVPNLFRALATDIFPIAGAVLTGTVFFTVLLPYIPGRAFAWKGWLLGIIWTVIYTLVMAPGSGWLPTAAYFLLLPALSAFLTMNFTGSSTYTSMSGVVKEMGVALPAILLSGLLGGAGLIASYFMQ